MSFIDSLEAVIDFKQPRPIAQVLGHLSLKPLLPDSVPPLDSQDYRVVLNLCGEAHSWRQVAKTIELMSVYSPSEADSWLTSASGEVGQPYGQLFSMSRDLGIVLGIFQSVNNQRVIDHGVKVFPCLVALLPELVTGMGLRRYDDPKALVPCWKADDYDKYPDRLADEIAKFVGLAQPSRKPSLPLQVTAGVLEAVINRGMSEIGDFLVNQMQSKAFEELEPNERSRGLCSVITQHFKNRS